jgi:hypothetical protein
MNLKKTTTEQTGLKKLPTAVRNKMGYMKEGGSATKNKGKKKDKGIMVVSISVGQVKKPKTKSKKTKKVQANRGVSLDRDFLKNEQKQKSQKRPSKTAATRGKTLSSVLAAAMKQKKDTFTYKGKSYNTKQVAKTLKAKA